MLIRDRSIIPSLMFHSIGLDASDWVLARISHPLSLFEDILRALARQGYTALFWDDVYRHVSGGPRAPYPSIMLTFDDGYLDNYVYLLPLLRRYGMKATIFVSADFIEPDGPPRPTLEQVWSGSIRMEDLQAIGFLRPSELRLMADSGHIDIQSHATTHTSLFTGDRVIDAYTPEQYPKYYWMAWNARPERKVRYMTEDQSALVMTGTPIFSSADALVARAFRPDPDAAREFAQRWVRLNNDPGAGAAGRIAEVLAQMRVSGPFPGNWESEAERRDRVEHELAHSRQVLQRILGRSVDYIAWPRGRNDAVVVEAARRAGYRAHALGSSDLPGKRNRPGEDPATLRRLSTEYRLFVRGRFCGLQGVQYQMLRIDAHYGAVIDRLRVAAFKAGQLIRSLGRGGGR